MAASVFRSAPALGILLATFGSGPLHAQRVIGSVVEQGDGSPVATAFVSLYDARDRRRAAGLTGHGGEFSLQAPDTGRYRIRVDRLGYRSTLTDFFTVSAAGAGPLRIEVPSRALEIAPIEVEGARRCVLRPEEGEVTFALWSEARKALEITEWVGSEGWYVFDALLFKRLLRPPELVVDTQHVEPMQIAARDPFYADTADKLLSRGFIQGTGADRTFYGPDASLLLSDAFLDTHCFRRVPADSAGLVGLAFEPVDPGATAEIQGVLWLDRRTAELRFLEFRYVNAPLPVDLDPSRYGGFVRFHRMDDGSWIVSHWRIRSPVLVRRARRAWLYGYTETEGDILAVRTRAGDAVPYDHVAGRLEGRVVRRRSGDPVAGVRVRIVGTSHETLTDEAGRYGFEGLPEGRYRVEAEGEGIRRVDSVVHVHRGAIARLVLGG